MKNKNSIFWAFAFMLISSISFGQCPHIDEVRLWDNSWSNPLSPGPSANNYSDFSNDCIPLFDTQFTQINITASQGNVYMAMYADVDVDGTFETQIFSFLDANGATGVNPTSVVQPGTPIRIIVSDSPITTGDQRPSCGEMEEYVICDEDPCEECFNFFGIVVLDEDDCDYEFVMDYAATGNCGAITIVSEDWDFGYQGGTGTGFHEFHSFPSNGTYTVTATIVYTTASGLTCTAVETTEVTVTGCSDPCEECFNFFGIVVLDADDCDYEFVMDYAATGNCGAITIVSEDWDFGYQGGTGTGFHEFHSFPQNGTYNVTATIVYTTASGLTCTAIETTQVTVTGCTDPCEDCFNFFGIEVFDSKGCDYELVMDYAATGNCGAITIISEDWDFGHFGGTGSGFHTTHTFPGNGVYTITATIVYQTATGATCTAVQTLDVAVNGCNDCECVNGGAIQTWNAGNCAIGFWLGGFGIDGCATLQPGYTWDFGDNSSPVTTSNNYTYYTYANPGTYAVTVSFVVVNNVTGQPCTQTYSLIINVGACGKEGKSMSSDTPPMDVFNVSAFPNPSEDVVTFSVDQAIQSADFDSNPELVIYDQMGREVHRSVFEQSTEQTIDFRNIGSGFYLYRITQNGQLIGDGEVVIK